MRFGTAIYGLMGLSLMTIAIPSLAALPVTSPATPPTILKSASVDAILKQAEVALAKGWMNDAIAAFQQALAIEPTNLTAQLGLAQAQQKNGNLEAAWTGYQQVLQQDRTNVIALHEVGRMGEYRQEWQQAGIIALTELLKQIPNDRDLLTQRALLLGFQGQFDRAWADYEKLIPTNTSPNLLLKAAQAAGFSGRTAQAIGLYDAVLQQTPNSAEAQLNRAFFALQAKQLSATNAEIVLANWVGKTAEARLSDIANLAGALPAATKWQALYNEILTTMPDNLPIQRRALQVLATQNPQLARTKLNQLMQTYANEPLAYFVQGEVAKSLRDLDLAASAYEALLQRQPDRVDGLIALGGVRFEQQRYREAEQQFMRAIELSPGNLEVPSILADLYATQDQPLLALKLLQELDKVQKSRGIVDPELRDRIAELETNNLRRRSFQPAWERY